MDIHPDDWHHLNQHLNSAHHMISDMRGLLESLHTAWEQNNEDQIFRIIDEDVYEMLQRFEPRED